MRKLFRKGNVLVLAVVAAVLGGAAMAGGSPADALDVSTVATDALADLTAMVTDALAEDDFDRLASEQLAAQARLESAEADLEMQGAVLSKERVPLKRVGPGAPLSKGQ